jgi:hypothetical protein
MSKYDGAINTKKFYNDAAETEVLSESFEFNGYRITLPQPLDNEEDDRDRDYISVDTKSDWNIFIYHDRIEIYHDDGWTLVKEKYEDLGAKCSIANKLAAVNRWK